jgi:predicted transglutaminase-like cysteine proteinase
MLSKKYFMQFAAASAIASAVSSQSLTTDMKSESPASPAPAASDASSQIVSPPNPKPSAKFLYLRERVETPEPVKEHDDFCQQKEDNCTTAQGMESVVMEGWVAKLLHDVNLKVNKDITYKSDAENFGDDRWVVVKKDGEQPVYGDCEDFAVTKRDILKSHIPASAMMLAYVTSEESGAHVVLIVRTTEGDKVLDNRSQNVRGIDETDYEYMYVTDPLDNKQWRTALHYNPVAEEGKRVIASMNGLSKNLSITFRALDGDGGGVLSQFFTPTLRQSVPVTGPGPLRNLGAFTFHHVIDDASRFRIVTEAAGPAPKL